jgi:hypothetical protein
LKLYESFSPTDPVAVKLAEELVKEPWFLAKIEKDTVLRERMLRSFSDPSLFAYARSDFPWNIGRDCDRKFIRDFANTPLSSSPKERIETKSFLNKVNAIFAKQDSKKFVEYFPDSAAKIDLNEYPVINYIEAGRDGPASWYIGGKDGTVFKSLERSGPGHLSEVDRRVFENFLSARIQPSSRQMKVYAYLVSVGGETAEAVRDRISHARPGDDLMALADWLKKSDWPRTRSFVEESGILEKAHCRSLLEPIVYLK